MPSQLGSLNLLFLSFVIVQFRTLFGGDFFVQRTAHLSYSAYARQGFTELLAASILGLVVLAGSRSLIKAEQGKDWKIFTQLSIGLIAMISVVMVSAAFRLYLYVQAYGVTIDRFYAATALVWLTLVFAWFAACIIRKKHNGFAFGVIVSTLVVVFGLNLLNPDGLIAQANLNRPKSRIDTKYLDGLSVDAIPVLIQSLPQLAPDQKNTITERLRSQQGELRTRDWRSWNLSSQIATSSLQQIGL